MEAKTNWQGDLFARICEVQAQLIANRAILVRIMSEVSDMSEEEVRGKAIEIEQDALKQLLVDLSEQYPAR